MYNKLNVKILGLIENMSYLLNPFTGDKMYLFGEQGVQKLAGEKELRFLGEVPLIQTIREAADAGKPLCLYNNTQEYQQYYNVIAAHIPDLIG
jgi:ATP-binding protein involved in chromosome partitioning